MTVPATACLLLAFILCTQAEANTDTARDCCLSTKDILIPHRIVIKYFLQVPDEGCQVAATIFVTKKQKHLCAPYHGESEWVDRLIGAIEKKNKHRKSKEVFPQ